MSPFKRLAFVCISAVLVASCSDQKETKKNALSVDGDAINIKGGYELPKDALLRTCPFMHGTLSFDTLLGSIQSQLQTKIEGNEACDANKRTLFNNLSTIQNYYNNFDTKLSTQQGLEVYDTFITDLQAQLLEQKTKPGSSAADVAGLESALTNLQLSAIQLRASSAMSSGAFADGQKLQMRREMFLYIDGIFKNLNTMDAKCVGSMGGWKQILPPLLGAASLASGYSVFAGQAIAGSVLQISSSIAQVMENKDAKKALQQIVQLNNEKVLACTYFAMQNATCEIRRGIRLAENNKSDLRDLLETGRLSKIKTNVKPEWSNILRLKAKSAEFEAVFEAVATQGSSLSLNVMEVVGYFNALKVNPKSLPPAPESDEKEQVKWLQKVQRVGVNVLSTSNMGTPLTIAEKVINAKTEINGMLQTLELIEQNLKDNKSFVDLKTSLIENDPHLAEEALEIQKFLEEQAKLLPAEQRSALLMSANTMARVYEFLMVPTETAADVEAYLEALSNAGIALFKEISRGSVAQISMQEILALGGKSQARLMGSFKLIENRLIKADIATQAPFEQTFLYYMQENELFYQLLTIYTDLRGTGTTFRDKDIQTAYGSLEKGFRDEFLRLVDSSLKLKSNLAPELADSSAPHFCSMLSGFLASQGGKGKSLLKECQSRFTSLKISTLSYESDEKIDWNDSCSYVDYIRKNRSFQVLDWAKRNLLKEKR